MQEQHARPGLVDIIPLFVRAGTILPLGEPVESTNGIQKIASLRVYPGADGDFDLYNDDGTTISMKVESLT